MIVRGRVCAVRVPWCVYTHHGTRPIKWCAQHGMRTTQTFPPNLVPPAGGGFLPLFFSRHFPCLSFRSHSTEIIAQRPVITSCSNFFCVGACLLFFSIPQFLRFPCCRFLLLTFLCPRLSHTGPWPRPASLDAGLDTSRPWHKALRLLKTFQSV